jgi:DNA helicase-2/ATP-dependent DNA helicase PcrA
LLAFDDTAAQYDYLAERVFDDIVTLDRQTVAVIGKTHHDCETAYRELLARDVTVSHNWVAEEGSYAGGLAVLTVSAAKGLEFDSVYVVEADASRYSAEAPYDARLLYVAITRALDALSVLAVGELTPLLR